MTQFTEFAETMFERARSISENLCEAKPFLFFLTDDGMKIVPLLYRNDEQKAWVFNAAREYLRDHKEVLAYLFIGEAWMTRLPPDTKTIETRPRDDLARVEILAMNGWSRAGEKVDWAAEIKTLETGRRVVCEPEKWDGPECRSEGITANLFEALPTVQ